MDDAVELEVLLPRGRAPLAPDPSERELSRLHAHPPDTVRASMVTTLDGAATGADGRSGSINNRPDHRVFHLLRSLADVVLVGAGTVRTERYDAPSALPGLVAARRERGQADHPVLAVVTRRADLPGALLDAEPRPWVFTTPGAPFIGHLRAHLPKGRLHVVEGADGDVDLAAAIRVLADAGLTRVVAEGGPALLGDLVARDLLDEVCLTVSPLLVGGDASRVVAGAPWLDPVRRVTPEVLLHAEGVLLGRWRLVRD